MQISSDTPVVVAGGASGLGAAVVRAFAGLGAPAGILDQDASRGLAMAQELGCAFAAADIADADSVAAGLAVLRDQQGQERICINCAGIAPAAKTVSRGAAHDPALFARVVAINLTGTFNVASQSALGMSTQAALNPDGERGVIVNTASVAAFEGQVGQIAYAASKAGVAGMTLPMARDLAKTGIRVVALAPGIFATPMVTGFAPDIQTALAEASEFPKRLGTPEEFAALVVHVVGNAMLNGEVIRLDGGARLQAR